MFLVLLVDIHSFWAIGNFVHSSCIYSILLVFAKGHFQNTLGDWVLWYWVTNTGSVDNCLGSNSSGCPEPSLPRILVMAYIYPLIKHCWTLMKYIQSYNQPTPAQIPFPNWLIMLDDFIPEMLLGHKTSCKTSSKILSFCGIEIS